VRLLLKKGQSVKFGFTADADKTPPISVFIILFSPGVNVATAGSSGEHLSKPLLSAYTRGEYDDLRRAPKRP